jgi:hypothetical protein
LAVSAVSAGTLNVSHLPNNGLTASGGGVFMDLTDLTGAGLNINGFTTYASSAAGSAWTVDVYTRPGSYVGLDGSSAGWTLHTTVNATSNGTTTLAPLNLGSAVIPVGANATTAVYLVAVAGGIRYNGTNTLPPITTWENTELRMFSDVVRSAPFAGTRFQGRTFAGTIDYTPIPEPASLGALAAGALLMLRRRK